VVPVAPGAGGMSDHGRRSMRFDIGPAV
jgi:hypothetical protein